MKVREIVDILNADIIVGGDLDREVKSACGSDMMSDVLAFVKDQSVLLTGMCNAQVIRTAMMMDMVCVVLVRGKQPDSTMIELAKSCNIVLMVSKLRMYSACGMLFANGLGAGEVTV